MSKTTRNVLSLGLFLVLMGLPSDAAELKQIQRRGHLIVAVKDNLRPLGFRDASGHLQGLEIDIAQRLAQDLLGSSSAVVLKPVANRDRLSVVLEGKVDLAIAEVAATTSRFRLVNFSIPYYTTGTGLITKDTKIHQLSNLINRKVAVLNGSSTIANLRFILPSVQMVGVSSYQEAQMLLDAGKASAFAGDINVLTGWVQQTPGYYLLPSRLSTQPLAIVLPKGLQCEALRGQINQIIGRWQVEGWLRKRIQYWGLPSNKL